MHSVSAMLRLTDAALRPSRRPVGAQPIAGKAFDADERVLEPLAAAGKSVIPSKANRTVQRDYDRDLYKTRRLIESFFAKLKQSHAVAARCDKPHATSSPASTSPQQPAGPIEDTP